MAGTGETDFMNELADLVSCSICMGFLEQPKSLLCGHSFCAHCLSDWHQSSVLSVQNRSSIQCPECRVVSKLPDSGINGLSTNYRINQIMTVVQAHQEQQAAHGVNNPVTEDEEMVGHQEPFRRRGESIYGSWRQHFSTFCKSELEEAIERLQERLTECESKTDSLRNSEEAFQSALERSKVAVEARARDIVSTTEAVKGVLLEQLEKKNVDYQHFHKQQTDMVSERRETAAATCQLLSEALQCPTRDMIRFFQENQNLVDEAKGQEGRIDIPNEINTMFFFKEPESPSTIGTVFGSLDCNMASVERTPAINPAFLESTANLDSQVYSVVAIRQAPIPWQHANTATSGMPVSRYRLPLSPPQTAAPSAPAIFGPRPRAPLRQFPPGHPPQHRPTFSPNPQVPPRYGPPHLHCPTPTSPRPFRPEIIRPLRPASADNEPIFEVPPRRYVRGAPVEGRRSPRVHSNPPIPPKRFNTNLQTQAHLCASAPNLLSMPDGTNVAQSRPLPHVPSNIRASDHMLNQKHKKKRSKECLVS